jgi:hypothetical protein
MRAPLTPENCDLRDFPRMMIDITRLRQSEFDATIDDAAWRAGVNLWFSAWHSVPAGSLAADDASLAKAAGLGRDVRTWKKVRPEALRGFIECSDGRLYHETVCEFALEAWLEKLAQRISSGAGNAKRWGGEFDASSIQAEIDRTTELLAALNPESRAIQKAKRRHSQRDAGGNPGGNGNPSRRDKETVPSGSQETGTETKEKNPPNPPDRPLPKKLHAVLEAGGFVVPPNDLGFLDRWLADGASLSNDILPVIRKEAEQLRQKTGRAPMTLKIFDRAIREKLDADKREVERLRRISAAYGSDSVNVGGQAA